MNQVTDISPKSGATNFGGNIRITKDGIFRAYKSMTWKITTDSHSNHTKHTSTIDVILQNVDIPSQKKSDNQHWLMGPQDIHPCNSKYNRHRHNCTQKGNQRLDALPVPLDISLSPLDRPK